MDQLLADLLAAYPDATRDALACWSIGQAEGEAVGVLAVNALWKRLTGQAESGLPCPLCGKRWWVPESEVRLLVASPLFCGRIEMRAGKSRTVSAVGCPFLKSG